MKITDCKVNKVNFSPNLKAYASIVFDQCFVVKQLRVLSGKNGIYVAMPSRKKQDGTYEDVAFPITKELREEIINRVISEYELIPENKPQDEYEALERGGIKDKQYDTVEVQEDDLPF